MLELVLLNVHTVAALSLPDAEEKNAPRAAVLAAAKPLRVRNALSAVNVAILAATVVASAAPEVECLVS